MAWNISRVRVNIIEKKEKSIHCEIERGDNHPRAFITFMYGLNEYMERRELWKDINHYEMDFNRFLRRSYKTLML